ncbi:MAG: hypothetical protein LUQ29_08750, partial [Methylococcaceae bacterium]|nr:hypothetical protein [Methylococcaceae bacterium]
AIANPIYWLQILNSSFPTRHLWQSTSTVAFPLTMIQPCSDYAVNIIPVEKILIFTYNVLLNNPFQ